MNKQVIHATGRAAKGPMVFESSSSPFTGINQACRPGQTAPPGSSRPLLRHRGGQAPPWHWPGVEPDHLEQSAVDLGPLHSVTAGFSSWNFRYR